MKNEKVVWLVGLSDKEARPLDEEKAINKVVEILLSFGVDGFSITKQTGYWKGTAEKSIKVETINTWKLTEEIIQKISEMIRDELKQEAVLTYREEVDYNFY